MGDKLIKQTPGNGRQLFETWDAIEMLLETGYAFEKQYVVAALRNATPEVVLAEGTPQEIRGDPEVHRIYLGYTKAR
jgi:ABC-type uncharacterized transport system ATPase subunit